MLTKASRKLMCWKGGASSLALALPLMFISANALAFEVGVHAHFRWYPNDPDKYLELIKRYGFTSYRADFPWSWLEQQKGRYVITSYGHLWCMGNWGRWRILLIDFVQDFNNTEMIRHDQVYPTGVA